MSLLLNSSGPRRRIRGWGSEAIYAAWLDVGAASPRQETAWALLGATPAQLLVTAGDRSALSRMCVHEHDAFGRPISIKSRFSDGRQQIRRYEYDEPGRVARIVDDSGDR